MLKLNNHHDEVDLRVIIAHDLVKKATNNNQLDYKLLKLIVSVDYISSIKIQLQICTPKMSFECKHCTQNVQTTPIKKPSNGITRSHIWRSAAMTIDSQVGLILHMRCASNQQKELSDTLAIFYGRPAIHFFKFPLNLAKQCHCTSV